MAYVSGQPEQEVDIATGRSTRPLRVLQLGPAFERGGIQRHILDLTSYLRDRGHHVELGGSSGPWGKEGRDLGFHALDLKRVSDDEGLSMMRRLGAAMGCVQKLRKIVARGRFDLVHSHETAPALVARLALAGQPTRRLFTFHGSTPERYGGVARSAQFAAHVTACPSRKTLDALIARGLPRARTAQLGLGVPPPPDQDPAAVLALRQELLRDGEGVLIFSPARLDPQKGIDVMIDVLARLVKVRRDIVIALAGHGPLADVLSDWIASAGVRDNIRVLGPIDTVPLHMAAADFMLLTSRWEALPISIVEAFHAGLPVIATDCGGVSELVSDRVGRLCPVGDVEGLTAAVLELAGDEGLRKTLGANARALAREDRFDPTHVHERIEQIYRQMLDGVA
ncbi:glycosyltransferase family 4 protein [Ruegeria sp. HKCCD6157]|uniref:glycosyltransferase family 4 protein n=1 Tax=Ruegeria sp. HKCCD6157 TaxID=2690707 RepID=UPI001490D7CF|nr:glycosyltransferase family 4 protein [Ruegeria sp. HKCCD6157]NOE28412.1 glycosyltransferase [Ruegeria sp. HKCCD6157]